MTPAHKLLPQLAQRMSGRQIRLFACACARHHDVWPLLVDPRSRRAVEVAEKFADGECRKMIEDAPQETGWYKRIDIAIITCREIQNGMSGALQQWLRHESARVPWAAELLHDVAGPEKMPTLCGRELFDPLENVDPVTIDYCSGKCVDCQRILAWNDGTLLRMAERMYADRCTDTAVWEPLTDALEEAGVDGTSEIVMACRGRRKCDNRGTDVSRICSRGIVADWQEPDPAEKGKIRWRKCERCSGSGSGWISTGGVHAGKGSWPLDLLRNVR